MSDSVEFLFAISFLLLIVSNFIQYSRNTDLSKKLKDALDKGAETEKSKSEILGIEIGDRGVIANYELSYAGPPKVEFKVTYEVDIVEVALDKLKVRATNYTSTDKVALDPSNRNGIILFLKDKWIDKNKVTLIIDDAKRREDKINQILS
jgi:hypothetical protein